MKNLTLRKLLLISMLVAGMVPLLLVSAIALWQSSTAMTKEVETKLEVVMQSRKESIERYMRDILAQNAAVAGNEGVVKAMQDMGDSFFTIEEDLTESFVKVPAYSEPLQDFYLNQFGREYETRNGSSINAQALLPISDSARLAQYFYIANNPHPLGSKSALTVSEDPSRYAGHHALHHPPLKGLQEGSGYYDVFLVEPKDLTIVYSVFKELDFGTSLKNGPYRDSGIAKAARAAMDLPKGETVLVDYASYTPSYDAPAAFSAAPIYDGGQLIGALVFQMPVDRIENILADLAGLGETGESVMFSLDDGRYRSNGRDSRETKLLVSEMQPDIREHAAANDSGIVTAEAFDQIFLAAYSKIDLPGLNWVMVTRQCTFESLAAVTRLQWLIVGLAFLVMIFVAGFGLFIARNLLSQLGADPRKFVAVASAMANGDLSASPDDDRATGAYAALVQMRNKLREVLHEATRISSDVQLGAQEMSEGNMGLSERTEQQAANLEETASSTEQLTSTVRQNADNAQAAAELSRDTSQRADHGSDIAAQAVTAMREISSSSNEIANIIGVIDEIAFQTNLLALNAAVEAARAGEQGRGFAVVATEVRQLAGRSATAAKEIKDLIQSSVAKVRDGTELVQTSGDHLESIAKSVTDLNSLVGQISQACVEQSAGIDQINQALIHMDSVTQQNAALVEEAAATSEAMRDQASSLAQHMAFFKLSGGAFTDATMVTPIKTEPIKKVVAASKASPKAISKATPKAKPDKPASVNISKPAAPAPVSLERHAGPAKKTTQWQSDKANTPPPIPKEAPKVPPPLERAASSDEVWEEF